MGRPGVFGVKKIEEMKKMKKCTQKSSRRVFFPLETALRWLQVPARASPSGTSAGLLDRRVILKAYATQDIMRRGMSKWAGDHTPLTEAGKICLILLEVPTFVPRW